ncbi:agglutinin-like ALS [Metschnikowia aff. pulcherrima]|uniref:Agglutinin-like ALS n=1 Tax=Metschnikowia aff. pulcherrima TaxID=2163413 RepID=A0A4P6XSF1_9ASCO|nr:agglutinin-like ALS [Metschnikowia aff. pulcherrima]
MPRATSTSFWTNSYTSTSTVTPSGGGRPTVIIEVPQATTTSYWVNSITSTTTVKLDYGSQPTVVIEIPFSTALTRTSTWSDSFTTTSTLTGTDGNLTPIVKVSAWHQQQHQPGLDLTPQPNIQSVQTEWRLLLLRFL